MSPGFYDDAESDRKFRVDILQSSPVLDAKLKKSDDKAAP
jgi:hypothetical protein